MQQLKVCFDWKLYLEIYGMAEMITISICYQQFSKNWAASFKKNALRTDFLIWKTADENSWFIPIESV